MTVVGQREKVALITGAGRGVGRAVALTLASRAGSVLVTDCCLGASAESSYELATTADLAETCDLCRRIGQAEVVMETADVRDADAIGAAVEHCLATFGRLDVLVSSAGVIGAPIPIHEISNTEWQWVVDVNLTGTFQAVRAAARAMIDARRGGCIVNIASTAGLVAFPHFASYVASKHALIGLTKAAALDLAPHRIRVNAVCPTSILPSADGPSMLGGVAAMLGLTVDEYEQLSLPNHPLGSLATDSDVAHAAAWLASDEAARITGAVLSIDAGFTVR